MPAVACGIDWAEGHHDVAIVEDDGRVVAQERVGNDAAGLARVLELLSSQDPDGGTLPIAIETSHGLLVAGLRAAGRQVFAITRSLSRATAIGIASPERSPIRSMRWSWPTS